MPEYLLPILMLISLITGTLAGYAVPFVLGGVSIIFLLLGGYQFSFFNLIVARSFSSVIENWVLIAIPLFVFMGLALEKSGLSKRLLSTIELLLGNRPGGLAIAVTLLGIIMAASTGIVGASVVMLGLLALPTMLEQNYDKKLAVGTIAASSTLGILIPPSIMLVVVGNLVQVSVGDLFLAAIFPGLMLGSMYILYIICVSYFSPDKAPPAKIDKISATELLGRVMRDLLPPVLLILSVLGSIAAGLATPTEAAAIGALCALCLALFSRQLNWKALRDTIYQTGLITSMILFVVVGAGAFSAVFRRLGGSEMIENAIMALNLGPYGILTMIMIIVFFMGFFLEWVEISYIVLPLFAPILQNIDFGLGFSVEHQMIWFATLVAVNMQTSFLTPPFGYALFYLKGVAPKEVTVSDINRGIIPFVIIQLIGLLLIISFPKIVMYLPQLMDG
ncbi:MAG: TRAP transporter large permease subunit [Desulfobacterales bacterium]|nr:TRAP transporter large permease subunit [Desulfobacterales bacterium]